MKQHQITPRGVQLRFFVALLMVFASYNPHGWSYLHWLLAATSGKAIAGLPLLILAGLLLVIGFSIYIRATLRSLGLFGLCLTVGFFATLIWVLIDTSFGAVGSLVILLDLMLLIIAAVLGTGMCWSHIRRRLTGQSDVDDVD